MFFNVSPSTIDLSKIELNNQSEPLPIYEFYNVLKCFDLNADLIKHIANAQKNEGIIKPYELYYLFPYNISLLEIQFIKLFIKLHNEKWLTTERTVDVVKDLWLPINGYDSSKSNESLKGYLVCKDVVDNNPGISKNKRIFTYNEDLNYKECLVGIGNARVSNHNTYFDDIRNKNMNITKERFSNLSEAVNTES